MIAENKKLTGEEWNPDDVLVLKRNPLLNTSHLELLSKQTDKNLNQLRVYEGVNLFIENKQVKHPQGLSITVASPSDNETMTETNNASQSDSPKWEIEHELDGFRFQVRYNTPFESGDEKMTDTSADLPETAITAASILNA